MEDKELKLIENIEELPETSIEEFKNGKGDE